MLTACSRDNFVSARPDRIIGMRAAAALSRLSVGEDGVVIIGIRIEFYRRDHAMASDDLQAMPSISFAHQNQEKTV